MDEWWFGSDDAMAWTGREAPPLPDTLLAELEDRYGPPARWTAEQCAEIGPDRIRAIMAWTDSPDVRRLLERQERSDNAG
jgi:hypothetical protein